MQQPTNDPLFYDFIAKVIIAFMWMLGSCTTFYLTVMGIVKKMAPDEWIKRVEDRANKAHERLDGMERKHTEYLEHQVHQLQEFTKDYT